MKVKIQQFLFGKNHSWSNVGKSIGRELLKRGHEVHFISTDGVNKEFVDTDLIPYIRNFPDKQYDLNFSYTAPKNFSSYLSGNNGFKCGMFAYEFPHLPRSFIQAISGKYVDKFMTVSNWYNNICLNENKISPEKLCLMPHGVEVDKFINAQPMKLNTDKKIKILINITQLHIRKNLSGTLAAIGEALNKNDDVCLILKVADKNPEYPFELKFQEIFKEFNKKYPNHIECLIIKDYIPNIESLYKACDILFLLSHAEAFSLTHAEGLIAGNIVFSSRYSGPLDFLTDNNSFLIDGKLIRAPRQSQYWEPHAHNSYFDPDVKIAAEKLRYCIDNFDDVKKNKLSFITSEVIRNFGWDRQVNILENIVK
jgi:glycosyltransferase involved in cell wall biosynthesis